MSSAIPERTNKAMAIKLRPNTDLLDPFTSSITTSPELKNLAGDGAEIMIGVAGYLMAHSIKLKNYIAMFIVMPVKYFLVMNVNFNCWRMAVFNLYSLNLTIVNKATVKQNRSLT